MQLSKNIDYRGPRKGLSQVKAFAANPSRPKPCSISLAVTRPVEANLRVQPSIQAALFGESPKRIVVLSVYRPIHSTFNPPRCLAHLKGKPRVDKNKNERTVPGLPRNPAPKDPKMSISIGISGPKSSCTNRIPAPAILPHQLLAEATPKVEGLVEKLTLDQAKQRFGDRIAISSLAVLVEEAHGNKRRVIHDATHGTKINNRIKCRDKQRSPGAREKRYLLSYYKSRGDVVFSLVGDISKAHRRFLHDPSEHGLLACRVRSSDKHIYINKVGLQHSSSNCRRTKSLWSPTDS